MKFKKLEISEKVIQRLTEYLSILKDVQKYENEINSIELSKIMNTTSSQKRFINFWRFWCAWKRI